MPSQEHYQPFQKSVDAFPNTRTPAGWATPVPTWLHIPRFVRKTGPVGSMLFPSAWLSKSPQSCYKSAAADQFYFSLMCICSKPLVDLCLGQLTRTSVNKAELKKGKQETQHTQTWATNLLLHLGHQIY